MGAPCALTLIASEFSLCTAMLEFVKFGLGFRIQDTPKLFMWDSVNQAECMIESMSAFPQLLLLLYTITVVASSPTLHPMAFALLCRRRQALERIQPQPNRLNSNRIASCCAQLHSSSTNVRSLFPAAPAYYLDLAPAWLYLTLRTSHSLLFKWRIGLTT